MNKGKNSGGAKLKEDMFKNDETLNEIFTELTSKTNTTLSEFTKDLKSFEVTLVNPEYLGNLFLIDGSGIIRSESSISVESRICTLTVHQKNKISTITQTIEKARNLVVNKSGNVLSVKIPDPTEERRERVIKEMREHSTHYIDQINSARSKALDKLKKIETAQKQNNKKKDKASEKGSGSSVGISEDDLKKAKELVEQIKNDKLSTLKALQEKQENDVRKGIK